MSLQCVIVDDEYLAIQVLREYITRLDNIRIQAAFTNPAEALLYVQNNKTDLLLLDIHMPYKDGFTFLQQLAYQPLVIFTTAGHEYAVKAYELEALDYLVKPISVARFEKAIRKAQEMLALKKLKAEQATTGSLTIKSDYKLSKINVEDICYIEGLNEYVKIFTTGKTHITLASLKELSDQLPAGRFTRIHKSYIINTSLIASFNSNKVVLQNNIELPVGRVYKQSFLDRMKEH